MRRWITQARRQRSDRRRRAGAIVEFAVVLPLLLTILFGIIEYGWVFGVRQTLQHAAREGARRAIISTSTEAEVNAIVDSALLAAHISGYSTTLTHGAEPDCVETVQISIPYNDVSLVGGFFGTHDYNLVGSASMRREACGS